MVYPNSSDIANTVAHTGRSMRGDYAMLLLRLWIGAMLIVHGSPKVSDGATKLTGSVVKMGFPAPDVFAWLATLSEFGGGILLVLGLGVRPAAFFAATTMAVAAFIRHADDPFGKKELALTYLVILIVFMIVGGGRFAIDAIIKRRRDQRMATRALEPVRQ